MSSTLVFSVFGMLLYSVHCTVFPPVSNPPPIPGQSVGTLDISEHRFYVQDDLQANPPQTVIKEDGFFSSPNEPKPEDQIFITDVESFAGDFATSTETFEKLYANGLPAIGPVATPPPDDNYVAQQSGISKIFPDNNESGIWVLTKGPNDQYVPEKWMQVPASRVVEIVNSEASQKVVSDSVNYETAEFPVKRQGPSIGQSNLLQQVWVRVPTSAALQKGFQNIAPIVNDSPSVKQINVPQTTVKQSFQPQLIKEFQPQLPPSTRIVGKAKSSYGVPSPIPATPIALKSSGFAIPPSPQPGPITVKTSGFAVPPPSSPTPIEVKTSGFVIPPPPPPPLKSVDLTNSKQTVIINQPGIPVVDKGNFVTRKGSALQQVRHIWVPTSQHTGKFITVPAGSSIGVEKSSLSKGLPLDNVQPVAVSDTWVLKQDGGALPRFEQQKSFPTQVIQKGNAVVDETPIVQFDSPKNLPILTKSIDAPNPTNIWPQQKDTLNGKTLEKVSLSQPAFPPPPFKTDSILAGKSFPPSIPSIQKMYSNAKFIQPLSPKSPPILASVLPATAPLVKNKPPCPLPHQAIPYPLYRPLAATKRQPMQRIMRVNRYPYGSYYILNPRLRGNSYAYPRQSVILQQTKNGVVRLVSTNQMPFPMTQRQVPIPVQIKQRPLLMSPVKATPRILYPSVQAASRLRYAFPWGGYLSALPASTSNIVAKPAKNSKKSRKDSSSSSSENISASSSESKSKTKEESSSNEGKEREESAESIATIDSVEPETEVEPEPEATEPVAPEIENDAEAEEVEATESEVKESIEAAESHVIHKLSPRSFLNSNNENTRNFDRHYIFNNERSFQNRKEINELGGRVIGSYSYRDQSGILRNIAYISDDNGYRSEVLNKNLSTKNPKTSNFVNGPVSESTTKQTLLENVTESPLHANLAFDIQRD